MTARYAVLVQERAEANIFSVSTGEKKRVYNLIKSQDGGETWEYVTNTDEADVLKLVRALNRMTEDDAVAALRYELDDNK